MLVKKALLVACAAALTTTPAWAQPAQTPTDKGSSHASPSHDLTGAHGKSHKCKAHKVAYVATGTLVSQTLAKDADGGYSGDVVVNVTRTNRHAKADKGTQVTYTLADTPVVLDVADLNANGVALDDLVAGNVVKVIGKVTTLAKKCDQSTFRAEKTIRRVAFHTAPVTTPES